MAYAIDIETHDPNLKKLGSGEIRKDGRILCIGCYGEGECGHIDDVFAPDEPEIAAILATPDTKIFHNGVYDVPWIVLGHNLKLNGKIEDTMTREVLLNEYQDSYSLDDSCRRRGIEGKNYADTVDAYWKSIGGKGKAIEHLAEMPIQKVAEYCKQDCKATYELYYKQQPLIEQYDLQKVNDTEAALYPVLLEMKRNGIRIDVVKRDKIGRAHV